MRTLLASGSFWPPSSASRWFRRRVLCSVVLLVLVLVGTACGTASTSSMSQLSPATTVSGRAPRPLTAHAWEQIALPAPATDVQGSAVSPTDPATIFACTAHLSTPDPAGGVAAQPMTLWRTTDSGAHWTRYAPLLSAGTVCRFAFASDDPQRVTLQVAQTAQDAQPCAHDVFYLTADSGATWQHLPPHASIAPTNVSGECFLQVTRHHLYLTYSFTFPPQAAQVSMLERSDDNGSTWTRADRGLGDNVLFSMPQIGPGDTLAVTVTYVPVQMPPTSAIATTFWMSTDAGATWRQVSSLPEGAGTFLLSSLPSSGSNGATWPAPDHPFYAIEHEQIPSNLYRERVLMSGDGHSWTVLPPLPVSGVSAERPGVLQALGVLPDGRLAVWGSDPQQGIPASEMTREEFFPAFWLWLWDPMAHRWQVVPSPLETPAAEGCGLCWQAQTAVSRDGGNAVYVARFDTQIPGGTTQPGLFRMRLPTGA